MVSPQIVQIFALCVLSFAAATPVETPGNHLQFPAHARETQLNKLGPVGIDGRRVSRATMATCPGQTLKSGSESLRSIVLQTVESSGSASLSSCLHKYVIPVAVALAVSVLLNLALFIRLVSLKRQRHRERYGIPLREVPRGLRVALPPMAVTTDSSVTLVVHPVPRF
ncbi:hypothetical protein K438DRAFT_1850097 [Mycena galopus ATCC 62051]|nr:hypothetical protein K438DRAFT_1850097 [Mycena galopus ATCC 62051]